MRTALHVWLCGRTGVAGSVFEAMVDGQRCCVKEFHPSLGDAAAHMANLRSHINEFALLHIKSESPSARQRLQDKCVFAFAYSEDESDRGLWVVLPLMAGNLNRTIEDPDISVSALFDYVMDVGSSLQAMHHTGRLHRCVCLSANVYVCMRVYCFTQCDICGYSSSCRCVFQLNWT
jgi:hypothetical protein